jgi:hypothetical protein
MRSFVAYPARVETSAWRICSRGRGSIVCLVGKGRSLIRATSRITVVFDTLRTSPKQFWGRVVRLTGVMLSGAAPACAVMAE